MNKKSTWIKSLKITGNVIFYSIILLLMIFSISNIAIASESDIPNIFGKGFVSVQSGSMDGGRPDSFKEGDLAYIDILNEVQKENLQPGQIIVFWHQGKHIIHRIVDFGDGLVITQGDVAANLYGVYGEDEMTTDMANNIEVVQLDKVIGRYTGNTAGLGNTMDQLRDPNGFLLWIVLPLFLFFIYEMVILAKRIIDRNKQTLQKRHEQEKEALKAEILAQLQKQQRETQ